MKSLTGAGGFKRPFQNGAHLPSILDNGGTPCICSLNLSAGLNTVNISIPESSNTRCGWFWVKGQTRFFTITCRDDPVGFILQNILMKLADIGLRSSTTKHKWFFSTSRLIFLVVAGLLYLLLRGLSFLPKHPPCSSMIFLTIAVPPGAWF